MCGEWGPAWRKRETWIDGFIPKFLEAVQWGTQLLQRIPKRLSESCMFDVVTGDYRSAKGRCHSAVQEHKFLVAVWIKIENFCQNDTSENLDKHWGSNTDHQYRSSLCETRTMVIYNGKCVKLKITTYKVVFQTVEINNIFSRRKFQWLL